MMRGLTILILVVLSVVMVIDMWHRDAGAGTGSAESIGIVLENQSLILQKLDAIDAKLDVLKMRIRQ